MRGETIQSRQSVSDENTKSRRWRFALVIAFAVLASAASGAQTALAGRYVMRNCDVPGYRPSAVAPWDASEGSARTIMVDACAAGGGVAFRIVGPQQLHYGEGPVLALRKPPAGPRSQIDLVKVKLWYAARLAGTGPALSVYSIDSQAASTIAYPRMITAAPGGESLSSEQELNPAQTDAYRIFIACGPISPPAPADPCVVDNAVPLEVRGMEVTLSEEVPPSVLQPSGSLLAGGPQTGVRTVTYAAADPQSGLAKVEVLLGNTVVATDDLTTRCFYSDFTVCPAAQDETLQVDTRAVANGSHALTVRVKDAAGNERVVLGDHPVEVANEPNPDSFAVVAAFDGTSRTTLTVPFGRRVVVRGRVTREGQPVAAGTAIEVLERLDRLPQSEEVSGRIKVKADGRFASALDTNRPSRTVHIAFRTAGGARVMSKALKLRVRAASRVRATLHGRSVRFSGRVLSGPIAKRGKRVVMEGRSPGSAWTQFKSLRTTRHGRFSGTYRLRVRRPGVVLKVRAIVPSESGYGYVGSRSRAVTLRVR